MAVWAYECQSCPPGDTWWVARDRTEEVAPGTDVLRVKVGKQWHCATVDRSRVVEVEAAVLREAVASDPVDCPDCVPPRAAAVDVEPASQGAPSTASLQAAAISIAGRRMVVVLVPLDLVRSTGEAAMLCTDLRPRFGGAEVVLMGQDEAGLPHYHGELACLALLAEVPVEHMPWKLYPSA